MKTTVDIPDQVMREAMKHAGTDTKREAVLAAMEDYNRRHRQASLVRHLGTFENFIDGEELQQLRRARIRRHGNGR